jgi:hypothetical protein
MKYTSAAVGGGSLCLNVGKKFFFSGPKVAMSSSPACWDPWRILSVIDGFQQSIIIKVVVQVPHLLVRAVNSNWDWQRTFIFVSVRVY